MRRHQNHAAVAAALSLLSLAGLLLNGNSFAAGVREGLALSAGLFIPAMLPYYVFVAFCCKSRVSSALKRLFAPVCRRLRVGDAAGVVLLTGFLGGYPAGSMATAEACGSGKLTRVEAERLMRFCTNAGPGFVIGAVGQTLLGSSRAGLLLYAAHLLSSLTLLIVSAFAAKRRPTAHSPRSGTDETVAGWITPLTDSVNQAGLSCLYAASFIAVCSGLIAVLAALLRPAPTGLAGLCALLEVTRGCAELSHLTDLPPLLMMTVLSAALGWGGLCVILQTASFCGRFVRFSVLLTARLFNALLNAGYTLLLCACLGVPEIALSAMSASAAFSSRQQTAALLLIAVGFCTAMSGLTRTFLRRKRDLQPAEKVL